MPAKPLRADAQRNRARVLEVACEVFAAGGLAVPIDEIARRAGVGPGTVYRHFPTKEALFAAIAHDRMAQLTRRAAQLTHADEPAEAILTFLSEMVESGATDRGLAEVLAGVGLPDASIIAEAEQELRDAVATLLTRAKKVGAVRPDITVDDVKTLMIGCVAMGHFRAGDAQATGQVMKIIGDGLVPARRP